MRTSSRTGARRLALVFTAALAAAALSACGHANSAAAGPSAAPSSSSPAAGSAPADPTTAAAVSATTSAPTAASGMPGSPGSPGSPAPAGGPVPAGFAATSVTFVSADEAFVLGTAPCAQAPCTSIVRTLDRGATWVGLPAPVVALGDPYSNAGLAAAWGIWFANPDDGFVFGNGLWATTDGGEHWTNVVSPGGSITDLEIIDDQVLALTDTCTAQSGCAQTETLVRRPLAGGNWSVVTRLSGPRGIATQARVAAVLDDGGVVVTGNGGLTFAAHAIPCDATGSAGAAVAVTGPDSLSLLCAGDAAMGSVQKTVYVSDDLGATWTKAGSPPLGGDPAGISGGTAEQQVVAAESGASFLYYSADGGTRWSTAYQADDGGAGFNDLGFTTTTDGVVVHGPVYTNGNSYGMPGQLLLTSDGGASWTTARF